MPKKGGKDQPPPRRVLPFRVRRLSPLGRSQVVSYHSTLAEADASAKVFQDTLLTYQFIAEPTPA